MIFDFSNRSFAITISLATIVFCLFTLCNSVALDVNIQITNQSYFYKFFPNIIKYLSNIYITTLFILIIASVMYYINQLHQIITKRDYLPPLIFVLLCSAFTSNFMQFEVVLSVLFFLIVFQHICLLYREDYGLSICFYCGFYLAISILLYSLVALLIPAVILGILTIKSAKPRSFIVFFAGLLTPFLFSCAYSVLTDYWYEPFRQIYNDISVYSITYNTFNIYQYLLIAYTVILVVVHRVFIASEHSIPQKTIYIKHIFNYFLISSLIILLLYSSISKPYTLMWSMLTAFPISNLFSQIKSNFWANILIIILITLVVLSLYM